MLDRVVSVKIQADVQGFVSGLRKARASVDDLTKADVPSAAKAYADLSNKAALAGTAIAVGLGVAVKRFADFDAAMSAVRANSGAAGAELDALREHALKLGADSQFSASEAAQGINELAKAGVASADVLGGGLKGALDLAAAGQIEVAQAAETTATALRLFNLGGDKATHVADLFAAGASKAQGGVSDMALAFDYAAGISASLGVSIEETAGTIGYFASQGILGEKAGTSYRSMLLSLTAPSQVAAKKMQELGINVFDAQGNFVGMAGAADELQRTLGPLDQATRTAALGQIFGNEAINAAIKLYEGGGSAVRQWTENVDDSGFAAKQAADLTDNLRGDLERLGGALDSVLIETGSGANASLRTLVQGFTSLVDAVGQVPGPVLLAGTGLAALALTVPKGIVMFREYQATLHAAGLSLERIAARGPRAAAGVNALGKATKALGVAMAGVVVADMLINLDDLGIGVQQLTKDLTGADDVVAAINKRFADSAIFDGGTDLGVKSLGDALRATFDPSMGQRAENIIGSVRSLWTDDNLSSMGVAAQRFKDLDSTLSGLVSSGAADEAARQFDAISSYAKSQGVSLDDLKAKFPGYMEALAGADNAQRLAAGSGSALADATVDAEASAADAAEAWDRLRDAIDGLGSPLARQRSAAREFEAALDAVTESVERNGRGLDIQSEKGRANQAALDAIRDATLEKVKADYELTGSTDAATKTMRRGREAFVAAATAAGATKAEAQKLATQLGLVPKDIRILVEQSGADAAREAIDKAARDRETRIKVRYAIEGRLPGGGLSLQGGITRAEGGPIHGSGTKTSDSVPVWASTGEFMQRAAAVDKYGMGFMHAVNALRFPAELARGYAQGGPIERQYAPRQSYVVQTGPATTTRVAGDTYSPTFVVQGADAYSAAQKAMREFEYRVVTRL